MKLAKIAAAGLAAAFYQSMAADLRKPD